MTNRITVTIQYILKYYDIQIYKPLIDWQNPTYRAFVVHIRAVVCLPADCAFPRPWGRWKVVVEDTVADRTCSSASVLEQVDWTSNCWQRPVTCGQSHDCVVSLPIYTAHLWWFNLYAPFNLYMTAYLWWFNLYVPFNLYMTAHLWWFNLYAPFINEALRA